MKRRWFQFRLRTLFVLVTLAALVTGVIQHIWFVRARIQFHEGRLVTCEERLTTRININALLFRMIRVSNSLPNSSATEPQRVANPLPSGHLLYFAPGSGGPAAANVWDHVPELLREREQEMARVEEAKRYHQEQVENYRRALWRPWLRVVEDSSQELPDLPPDPAPPPAVPSLPEVDAPSNPSLLLEAAPPVLEPPPKVKSRWQSIERPLPPAFDERDVQVEKAADA